MRVRALVDIYIAGTYREAGAVFDYEGPSEPSLVPVPVSHEQVATAVVDRVGHTHLRPGIVLPGSDGSDLLS